MAIAQCSMITRLLILCALTAPCAGCILQVDCDPADPGCATSAAALLYAPPACLLSRSAVIDPANWPIVQSELLAQAGLGSSGEPTVSLFGSAPGGAAYFGGALAPNGKIYLVPYNATEFAVIDPDTETVTKFGTAPGGAAWSGAVLAPNGKIYGMPADNSSFVVIDPETNTAKQVPITIPGATRYYTFGVLGPNGKIYAIPTNATAFLVIDPETDTATPFGTAPGGSAWVGGALAPNGRIYAMPNQATTYVEIDPGSNTATTFGANGQPNAYQGAGLAPSGRIFGAAFDETRQLVLDPFTRGIANVGSVAGTAASFVGAVTTASGRIMLIPVNRPAFAYVDSFNLSYVEFASSGGGAAYESGILARNGKVYPVPFNATQFAAIDPKANGHLCDSIVTSGYFNKN